jgi:hypothetical protein
VIQVSFVRTSYPARAYDGRGLDRDAVEDLIFSLAESFGVSETFMRVRLDRYDLLRTGRSWDAH